MAGIRNASLGKGLCFCQLSVSFLFEILTATAKNAKGAAAVELVKQALEVINQN
jgi:hypothetical protein